MKNQKSIGIVKWFGGYNHKTGKENNYGFIESLSDKDLYVHKNNLNGYSSLIEKDLVSFSIVKNKKNDKLEALNVQKITINEISSFELIKEEFIKLITLFPNKKEIFRSLNLFLQDKDIQILLYGFIENYKYRFFLNLFNTFLTYKTVDTTFDSNIYKELSESDWELAKKWVNKQDNDFELARMISARSAEKIAKIYYESLDFIVEDIAITQNQNDINSNKWKLCDLELNNKIGIDVKNARFSLNSDLYSDHCVPSFKESRNGQEINILGVVSPYIKVSNDEVRDIYNKNNKDIYILGETSLSYIKELEIIFNSNSFTISNTDTNFIPEWLFEYRKEFYKARNKILEDLLLTEYPNYDECKILNINPIPLYIILGQNLNNENLNQWKLNFSNQLLDEIRRNKAISMPFLYLSILKNFLEELNNKAYNPSEYKEILYFQEEYTRPIGIHDDRKYIYSFINTLSELFNSPVKQKIKNFNTFKFNRKGILLGKESIEDNKYTSIFAYCGGKIQGKGACGNKPLLIGREKTCKYCRKLICAKCDFCSKSCRRSETNREIINFLITEKQSLQKSNEEYSEDEVFNIIYCKKYSSKSGKEWSLKSLNKEYIVNAVFPKTSHLQRKLYG